MGVFGCSYSDVDVGDVVGGFESLSVLLLVVFMMAGVVVEMVVVEVNVTVISEIVALIISELFFENIDGGSGCML